MILSIIQDLLTDEDSDKLLELAEELSYLSTELFHEYEPRAYSSFEDRLELWLGNTANRAERKALFQTLAHVFFVARGQMNSLCRTAYNDQITRWVIDNASVDISDSKAGEEIEAEMRQTWFCPMTDSMRINKFLKLNDIEGHKHRPDWRSLSDLGDAALIRTFVDGQKIRRLVLLEDFVGTGRQMLDATSFALETLPDISILVVPLICCPDGASVGDTLQDRHDRLSVRPVLVLNEVGAFIRPVARGTEPREFATIRDMSGRYTDKFVTKFGDPFGHGELGSLTVLHTNCPDNALPILYDDSESWHALFPRVGRVDH